MKQDLTEVRFPNIVPAMNLYVSPAVCMCLCTCSRLPLGEAGAGPSVCVVDT
jgi:hypothetical protein